MHSIDLKVDPQRGRRAFTLVEMLVVVIIMAILMTAGAIGLSGMTGKSVTSSVASAESLFDEARLLAVSQQTRARVLIAQSLTNNPNDNLRHILVASADLDPLTGVEKSPVSWTLSNRGVILPDQAYFSKAYSFKVQKTSIGTIPSETPTLTGAKSAYAGSYFYYEFNSEGICTTPGAGFVIGNGARRAVDASPVVTAAGKRDFGGFVVWRNGRTSVFRSPAQISNSISSLAPGSSF